MSTNDAFRLTSFRARRLGLRVALAVPLGLCMGLVLGDPLPFLAPMFAAQFLLASPHPMTLRQGVATVLIICLSGSLLVLATGLFRERPLVLAPLLWLFYFSCFEAQGRQRGGAGPGLMLVIGVVVPLLDIVHRDLGEWIVSMFAKAIGIATLLAWGAHALLPDPAVDRPAVQIVPLHGGALITRQATANASILLAIVVLCLSDSRLATAMVVPITVASLLNQLEPGMSLRAAIGLVAVNLLGGVVASMAFALFQLHPSLWLVVLIALLVSLLFAGKAAMGGGQQRVFGGGLIVFLVLFGLGISPLPNSTPDLFATRIAYVLAASCYAVTLAAVLWPRPRQVE
ncbi:DUF2955 domain-containing protein [Pseudomonas sp. 8O]|uniref:DUF2955 domain-containing protein n=1 Tax=Pseudomonas sp. 8O TaxID=2653165 RepID=UPI002115AF33|nr:DUF2955 domain-containing protein [Pseudomonas sp. 8O]